MDRCKLNWPPSKAEGRQQQRQTLARGQQKLLTYSLIFYAFYLCRVHYVLIKSKCPFAMPMRLHYPFSILAQSWAQDHRGLLEPLPALPAVIQ